MSPGSDDHPTAIPESAPAALRPEAPAALRPSGDPFRGHRARDAALVLPLAGLVLVAPPAINLFLADVTVFGAPLIGVYLFVVWALLIFGAQRLSRRLGEDDPR
jgi:hypothetical protein